MDPPKGSMAVSVEIARLYGAPMKKTSDQAPKEGLLGPEKGLTREDAAGAGVAA